MIDEDYLLHKPGILRLRKVAVLSNVQKPTQRIIRSEEAGQYVQMKEQDKSSENCFNKMEIGDLPSREFKIMAIKMYNKVWRTM